MATQISSLDERTTSACMYVMYVCISTDFKSSMSLATSSQQMRYLTLDRYHLVPCGDRAAVTGVLSEITAHKYHVSDYIIHPIQVH